MLHAAAAGVALQLHADRHLTCPSGAAGILWFVELLLLLQLPAAAGLAAL